MTPSLNAASPFRRAFPKEARIGEWTAPDGWRHRRFDWPAPRPRGRLLFQTGRGDVVEKYLETLAHFQSQGWSVTAFDWRGQGKSGRLSANPRVGHATSFARFVEDIGAFWQDWTREEGASGPVAVLGHSMGGHLVLRALAEGVIDPDAAVLVAPMLGLKSPLGAALGGRLARFIAGRGDPARAAWKNNERPGVAASRQMLLTHDRSRYEDEIWWYAQDAALQLGPPSWAWVAEAFASTAALAADPRLASLRVPLLMLVADADRLVDSRAACRIAARIPSAELIRYGRESAHEILREADGVRDKALAAIDSFLDAKAPA